jgi:precorrin-3B C17-methyltransferase
MPGKIFLVGIGPGKREHMSLRAIDAIKEADVIVGYRTYLGLVKDLIKEKEVIPRGMKQEVERAKLAVEKALEGKKVAVISSGDPGVYAMASAVFEYLKERNVSLDVEVIPGITAASAASALLGSPLGHDSAAISLSDLLTPWEVIENRLEEAAKGDFVIVLYNPKSKGRKKQIEKAAEILKKFRKPETPVGIVRNAMREGGSVKITSLEEMLDHEIDMLTTVIVGNSKTFVFNGRMVTPRGYTL